MQVSLKELYLWLKTASEAISEWNFSWREHALTKFPSRCMLHTDWVCPCCAHITCLSRVQWNPTYSGYPSTADTQNTLGDNSESTDHFCMDLNILETPKPRYSIIDTNLSLIPHSNSPVKRKIQPHPLNNCRLHGASWHVYGSTCIQKSLQFSYKQPSLRRASTSFFSLSIMDFDLWKWYLHEISSP